jgi:mannose-1-phosphate guanylyltransferase
MILAAGFGTRLGQLSAWLPKPLVPIGDRPAVAHVLERLRAAKALREPIVVNAHHRAVEIAAYARGVGLAVSHERELLGTGGGIHHAAALLGAGDVLVWNGDMIGALDVDAVLAAHAERAVRGALATLVVALRSDDRGNTGLDAQGDVVRLRREACRPGEVRSADFLGIHVVGAALRAELPVSGGIIEETYLPAMRRGARLASFACEVPFLDVGTPRAYLEANLQWLARRGLPAFRAEGATCALDVTLDRAVLGAGARVVGTGALERCVVWPGAMVDAPRAGAIVGTGGIVSVD